MISDGIETSGVNIPSNRYKLFFWYLLDNENIFNDS